MQWCFENPLNEPAEPAPEVLRVREMVGVRSQIANMADINACVSRMMKRARRPEYLEAIEEDRRRQRLIEADELARWRDRAPGSGPDNEAAEEAAAMKSGGMTVKVIAQHFSVSPRTVYRWLKRFSTILTTL